MSQPTFTLRRFSSDDGYRLRVTAEEENWPDNGVFVFLRVPGPPGEESQDKFQSVCSAYDMVSLPMDEPNGPTRLFRSGEVDLILPSRQLVKTCWEIIKQESRELVYALGIPPNADEEVRVP